MIHLKVVACFISCKSVLKEINHQHQQHQPAHVSESLGLRLPEERHKEVMEHKWEWAFIFYGPIKFYSLNLEFKQLSQHAATDKDNLISIAKQSRPHLSSGEVDFSLWETSSISRMPLQTKRHVDLYLLGHFNFNLSLYWFYLLDIIYSFSMIILL